MTAFNYSIFLFNLITKVQLSQFLLGSFCMRSHICPFIILRIFTIINYPFKQNSSIMRNAHIFQLIQPSHNSPLPIENDCANIFLALGTPPQKLSDNDLQHSKSYEVVGVRELKAYKNRAKKRTKVGVRDTHNDLPSDRSISRESSKKKSRPDPELLNKEEVIECLPKLSKQQSSHHLTNIHKASWIDSFSIDPLSQPTLPISKNSHSHHKKLLKEFSVSRIKLKCKEHQSQWKRLFRSHQEGQKFPTLNESIVVFLRKKEQQAGSPINENLVNIKSSFWTNTLRNCTNIDDVCFPRKDIRTLHEGVKAKGNSKLIQQTDWIQSKDQQGFRFKNCPEVIVPLPLIKPGIR